MVWDYRVGIEVGTIECPSCGDNQISQSEFHCGHIVAESKGGTLKKENLLPICSQCNLSMYNRNMRIFMKKQFDRKLDTILKECKELKLRISSLIKILKRNRVKRKIKQEILLVLS